MKTIKKLWRQHKAWRKKRNALALTRAKAQIRELEACLEEQKKWKDVYCRQLTFLRREMRQVEIAIATARGESYAK